MIYLFFILVVEFELKLGLKKITFFFLVRNWLHLLFLSQILIQESFSSFSYTVSDIWRDGKQKDEVWGSMRLYLYRLDQPINSTDEDK